ncbi:MAG: hypothetical protein KGV44_01850 [Flavobacteriaceae bacterium]|nr:hypothetical protein [Flavobacteriaceae bacterium]
MSSGAGHIMDMVNRVKQNRTLLSSHRSKFKGNNRDTIYSSKKDNQLKLKTLPKEELNKRKQKIREQAKAEQKKDIIIYTFLAICITIALIGILMWLNLDNKV